jgi:DHA2 family multidrug resistance protein
MPGGWKPKHSPWLIAVAVMIATFMEVMDTSIASVAVPYIAGSTASTNEEAEWVLTVYLVANAVFLPASNWMAMRFGRKRFLMTSIGVFTVASFLCGIAPTLPFILMARAIQGAGGGALQPLSQAILLESFPEEKQGQALGLYALGVVLAPVIGPAFGGYLTDAISWRWAFYINIPIGILAIALQSKFLEDSPAIKNAHPGKLDGIGLGLLGIWIGCLQFVLDKGQEDDWFGNMGIRWAVVICIITFILFMIREFTHDKPLVDLRALRDRNLGLGCLLVFGLGAVLYALTTVLPVIYQTLLGYDATNAGLVVSPRGLGSVVASVGVGILVARMNPKWIVAGGFTVLGLSSLWLSFITLDISPTTLFWPTTISGFGLAMIFVPLSKVALGTLPPGQTGNASGLFNFLRNIGGSVGISAANTIAQRHLQSHRNDLVHWYSGASTVFQQTLRKLTAIMQLHAGPRRAILRAYRLADNGLNHQAQIYAYVDDFRYLALLCLICIPLAFFFKRPDPGAQGGAG